MEEKFISELILGNIDEDFIKKHLNDVFIRKNICDEYNKFCATDFKFTMLTFIINAINIFNNNYSYSEYYVVHYKHRMKRRDDYHTVVSNRINTNPNTTAIKYVRDNISSLRRKSNDDILEFILDNIHYAVELVLELGADVNDYVQIDYSRARTIMYPIVYALHNDMYDIIKLLIEYDVDFSLPAYEIDDDCGQISYYYVPVDRLDKSLLSSMYMTKDIRSMIESNSRDNFDIDSIFRTVDDNRKRTLIHNLSSSKCLSLLHYANKYDEYDDYRDMIEESLYIKDIINVRNFLRIFNLNLSMRLQRKLAEMLLYYDLSRKPRKNIMFNTVIKSPDVDDDLKSKIINRMIDSKIEIKPSILYDLLNSNIDVQTKNRMKESMKQYDIKDIPFEMHLEINKFIK